MATEGFDFARHTPKVSKDLRHTIVGRIVLNDVANLLPENLKIAFLEMISGHHGVYQRDERSHRRDFSVLQEAAQWTQLRKSAMSILESIFLLNRPCTWPNPSNISAAIAALNGFVILCDWLGSDENYFVPSPNVALFDYISRSRERAARRVGEAGFFWPTTSHVATTFAELFPDRPQPRPLQLAIDAIPLSILQHPCLAIIEAPTGEGKTEAALTLARRIAASRGTDEMYIALPTTATSNAMFTRIQKHMREHLKLPSELVKLVHGQDFLVENDLRLEPMTNGEFDEHPALTWFTPKKQALLAPFAVGTVDQAELSALNVRHNALRLIGLAGKVVILDEVHAYDTYMTTIIEQMLRWLAALSSSVILLSATLPTARRLALASAFIGTDEALSDATTAYPNLLVVSVGGCHQDTPSAFQPVRTVALRQLRFTEEEWEDKARWLVGSIENGGCACWIANTVQRAQQIYRCIMEIAPEDVVCELLHARFPLEDRQAIERRILDRYGENGQRPCKGIVVGTQVLEQSLDLDFDVMVSDLAPIDLLLQRAGRLHRHERKNRVEIHSQPTLYVQCELADGELRIGADRFYTEYLLRKTWEILQGRDQLNLPNDYRTLVDAVYDETLPSPDSSLYDAWQKRDALHIHHKDEARLRLAGDPDPIVPFCQANRHPFQEDEDSSAWVVAQTRLGQESVTIILLERIADNLASLVSTDETITLDRPASREDQLRLLRRSLRLSNPNVVGALKQAEAVRPILFTESPLLKQCHPLWLDQNSTTFTYGGGKVTVNFNEQLGLMITRGE